MNKKSKAVCHLISIICFLVSSCINCPPGKKDYEDPNDLEEELLDSLLGLEPLHESGCQFGKRQSPIDLPRPTVVRITKSPTLLKNFDSPLNELEIVNLGTTVEVSLSSPNSTAAPEMSGGCLQDSVYSFEQFHFHWGQKDGYGSEHFIDGDQYSLEMHIVMKNKNSNPATKVELAVLSVLFEATPFFTSDLSVITQTMGSLGGRGSKVKISKPLCLNDLIPGPESQVLCYGGSLTTPPYSENVSWVVFSQPLPISFRQLDSFRYLSLRKGNEGMLNNYRELQPHHGRRIFRSSVILS